MLNVDPERPIEAILDDIRTGVATAINSDKPAAPLAAFGALLVRLSRDAEKTAAAVNARTKQLIVLTLILIGLTIILIGLAIPITWNEVAGRPH